MLKRRKIPPPGGDVTVVAQHTLVAGDIHVSGCLEIRGRVQGRVLAGPESDAQVRIAGSGHVEGEIRAPVVVINGAVDGDVHAGTHLKLASRARVKGDVYYQLVEIEVGAEINGSLRHTAAKSPDVPSSPGKKARAGVAEKT